MYHSYVGNRGDSECWGSLADPLHVDQFNQRPMGHSAHLSEQL